MYIAYATASLLCVAFSAVRGRTLLVTLKAFRRCIQTWDCVTLSTGVHRIHYLPTAQVGLNNALWSHPHTILITLSPGGIRSILMIVSICRFVGMEVIAQLYFHAPRLIRCIAALIVVPVKLRPPAYDRLVVILLLDKLWQ